MHYNWIDSDSKVMPRGFVYEGTIVSNGDLWINGRSSDKDETNYTGNNHGSIVQVGDQWYVFYHRQTNRHHYSRQGLAEPIEIREDGTIPQVEMTSCGLNNGPLLGRGEYESHISIQMSIIWNREIRHYILLTKAPDCWIFDLFF
ncbi:family 43 glycosylhydrolase [Paenibacillus crassostreae]|uniref:Uncharacterized protein n=1 Tax=Paenibacillus crassostreae TaxID=1763538 RepID=A0A167BDM1_9BACL|nr:family 43 glycosylhydrolase [Paenibacillus crassostreae]AOZ92939.1 hypothetical protein LPB68_12415 [Paenibacillus crassostreae]OAB71972.1 hypothetical protein PNBC_18475 [Paenibacillus crassostreae]